MGDIDMRRLQRLADEGDDEAKDGLARAMARTDIESESHLAAQVVWKKGDRRLPHGETPRAVEMRRGRSDALAGHGPALFAGPYMIGYRRGRAEVGLPMEHRPPSSDRGGAP